MKKKLALFLSLMLLLVTGCGKKPSEETLSPEMPAPETTGAEEEEIILIPETVKALAEVNGVPVILTTLSRGDMVEVADQYDDKHYVVKTDLGYGLVEKNLLRLREESAPEPWTGYAYDQADLYDNYRLAGEPIHSLACNTAVEVLDDLGWCLLVSYQGSSGYMAHESLSRYALQDDAVPSGGESKETPPADGVDGGDISLGLGSGIVLLSVTAPQGGDVSGLAMVLADGTDVILGYFDRGETVPVVAGETGEEKEGCHQVYLNGLYAWVSEDYVLMTGELPFDAWDGVCKEQTALYEDMWMQDSPLDRLNANASVRVIGELEHCYLVEAEDIMGYIPKDKVIPGEETSIRETIENESAPGSSGNVTPETSPMIEVIIPTEETIPETAPTEAPPEETKDSGDSGTGPEWTPPIL